MFTGIITEMGTVTEVRHHGGGVSLSVAAPSSTAGAKPGDSIAVSGVCQTIVRIVGGSSFTVEAVEETLAKTTLGLLQSGAKVNLETPLRLGDQLGGHIVQGHVDGVGIVRAVVPRENSWIIETEVPEQLMKYVAPIGSIAIDGISLTVAAIHKTRVEVSVIPFTRENTTLGDIKPGSKVNIECDILAKYVERLVNRKEGGITPDLLTRWGYEP